MFCVKNDRACLNVKHKQNLHLRHDTTSELIGLNNFIISFLLYFYIILYYKFYFYYYNILY